MQQMIKKEKLLWGILGCGGIARKFAESMKVVENSEILAGASRTGRAVRFCQEYGIKKAFDSYEALLSCKEISAVYIANTHNFHYETGMLALKYGKHVLMEKPFTVNAKEAVSLLREAKRQNLFMMEAMWVRFLPAAKAVKKIVREGAIGTIQRFNADFCFHGEPDPQGRLLNPSLAGGALLDVGIYPVSYASMLFGRQPEKIKSFYIPASTGVDEQSVYLFYYGNGMAVLSSGVNLKMENRAEIVGDRGKIVLPSHFYRPDKLELTKYGIENIETVSFEDVTKTGFSFQIEEANRCIRNHETESAVMPREEIFRIMKTMDKIRKQWNFSYKNDK